MPTPGTADGPVLIVGTGAVGGFLACLFLRSGAAVECMAGPASAAAIARDGLILRSGSFGTFQCRPAVVATPTRPPSLVIVAAKADTLDKALEPLKSGVTGEAVVLPLLNGCEHLAPMRRTFGGLVCAGSIGKVEVYRDGPTRIVHTTATARIELAGDDPVLAARLPEVAGRLRTLGLEAEQREAEAQVVWEKLVRLCPLAAVTAAAGLNLGGVRADAVWRGELEACVAEAAAVAAAEGCPIPPSRVLAQVAGLADGLETSLQRDIARGCLGELETILGAVCRTGARHGLSCPTIARLAETARQRCLFNARALDGSR